MSRDDFSFLQGLIRERSGIQLDDQKGYLVESRLTPILRREGFGSFGDLVRRLKDGGPGRLERDVVEAVTTNETSFFRDFAPFETIRTTILPELLAQRNPLTPINVWSAACASGQEAYSLAMIVRDGFPGEAPWRVRLLASDLSEEMLRFARDGVYSQLAVNRGLPASLLVKHFEREGLSWRLNSDVRRMVEFRRINLKEEWGSLPPMDLILLRNVLFYFAPSVRRSIVRRIRRALRPGGYVMLGASETGFTPEDGFDPVPFGRTICYRVREEKEDSR